MNASTIPDVNGKTALITGAAKRIGAETSRMLHAAGYDIVIHYNHSARDAEALCAELNDSRSRSCTTVCASLDDIQSLQLIIDHTVAFAGRLDVLVNNASSFYPTPLGSVTEEDWDVLFNSNLKGPLFLCQLAAPLLKQSGGCIINMVDVHGQRPLRRHSVYCAAKAGLIMLTKSLAQELGVDGVRVNGVAPGIILWPEAGQAAQEQQELLSRTALRREGQAADIAKTILFLSRDADYITGQILPVDGGRTVNQ